jgi:hypothetical protein
MPATRQSPNSSQADEEVALGARDAGIAEFSLDGEPAGGGDAEVQSEKVASAGSAVRSSAL